MFVSNAAVVSAAPATPADTGAVICGNSSMLDGPSVAPAGAITVPAGDNSNADLEQANTTYWFAPGTHTLGTGQYDQITPNNNATYIGAPGAIIDGKGKNSYAFTGTATGVTIEYLTIQNFGIGESPTTPTADDQDQGVVNHDSGAGWTVKHNTMRYNGGAALFLGSNNTASYNCLTKNAQYGFQVYNNDNNDTGATLDHNEISYNDTYDFESKNEGCGCTGGGKFWSAANTTITNNYIHDNYSVGLWADTNDRGFDIEGNYISNNASEAIIYEISYNALIKNNTFIKNAIPSGAANPGFATGAVYISESGGDSRVSGNQSGTLSITGNVFTDNWGGVTLYENANRYCSSSANTSSGDCTLVNPSVANLTTCASSTNRAKTPYINDCRWKTQNVSITNNTFNFTPANIGSDCTVNNSCGMNGLFSISGCCGYSPYDTLDDGWIVPLNISNNQNNVFSNNTYNGPWNFQAFNQGRVVNWSQWTGGFTEPDSGTGYHFNAQDAGSTYNGTPPSGGGSSGGGGTTTPAPTAPGNLKATAATGSVALTWSAATDSGGPGLGGYTVVRNGGAIATVGASTTSYTDKSVLAGTTYTYTVRAYDTSSPAIVSTDSNAATVTVPVSTGGSGGSSSAGTVTKTFEDGTDGMNSWFGDTVAQSSAQAHGGSNSLAVGVGGQFWGVIEDWPGTTITPGATYTFDAWLKAGTKADKITETANWLDASGTTSQTADVATVSDTTSGWTHLSGTLIAPAGAASVALDFSSANGAGGTVQYIDDVSIANAGSTTTPPPADTAPPSVPADVKATAQSPSAIALSWSASTDTGGSGLKGYYVLRNGVNITPNGVTATSYTDNGLNAATAYGYAIEAYDGAGNVSAQSTTASATTQKAPDTTPPSVPTGLTAAAASTTQINLAWTASTDNVGVAGYDVYMSSGSSSPSLLATVSSTSYGTAALSAGTTYSFYVIAVDAAGNKSQPSSTVSATTQSEVDSATVQGLIKTRHGLAVGGAYVQAYDKARRTTVIAYSNNEGQYVLADLTPGTTYQFNVQADGYQSRSFRMTPVSGVNIKDISLKPARR